MSQLAAQDDINGRGYRLALLFQMKIFLESRNSGGVNLFFELLRAWENEIEVLPCASLGKASNRKFTLTSYHVL